MSRDLSRRLDRLEAQLGSLPSATLVCRLTADRQTLEAQSGMTLGRQPDELEAHFWRRAAIAFGVEEVIGLVDLRPEEVKRGPDGRIDAASLSDEALAEILDARRRARSTT